MEKKQNTTYICPWILLQTSESGISESIRSHNNLLSIGCRCLKGFLQPTSSPCSTNSQKWLTQDGKAKHIISGNNVVNPRIRPDYIWNIAHVLPRTKVLLGLKTTYFHFMSKYYLSRVSYHTDSNSKPGMGSRKSVVQIITSLE